MQDLYNRFRETARRRGERIAIQYRRGESWHDLSYAALAENVKREASFLSSQGIGKGDRVAIFMENRPEWPILFFAALSLGAIAVPINAEADGKEAKTILDDSGSLILFVSNAIPPSDSPASNYRSVKRVVNVDSVKSVKIGTDPIFPEPGIEPSDLACILYTSGTTDTPKGVMLTHKNLLSNCEALFQLGIVSEKDSVLSILPLHHIYPMTVTMILPLLSGGKVIYPGSLRPEVLSRTMRDLNPTMFAAVPQVFYSFHKKIVESLKKIPFPFNIFLNAMIDLLYLVRKKTGINPARRFFARLHGPFGKYMRLFASGGAKLDEKVEEDLFRFGFTILEGYGLTETSPVLTFNPLKRPKIGSVGKAIPGVEIKILERCESGMGEILARGPNIMKGYYKREDLTNEVLKDGWFYTGDLGHIDEDGYLFITGRSKDIIVLSSGLKIQPEEVEEAYSKKAPVKEMCVFEVPFAKGIKDATSLWAVVRPDLEYFRKYGEVNLKIVLKERFDNVSKTLPSHKRLMGFSITLEELPHTPLGKIKRFAVRREFLPKIMEDKTEASGIKELSAADIDMLGKDPAKRIVECLAKQTGIERDISPKDSLELDLGIDSLGRIELASGLEAAFGIQIKDEVVGRAFTVGDLISGIEPLLEEGASGRSAQGKKEIRFNEEYWKSLFEVAPKKENLEKIDLSPGVGAWLAGFVFVHIVRLFFRIFCNLKVEGRDNIPARGPLILYANHTSYFDGLLVAASMPRLPRLDMFFVGFRPYFDVPIVKNLVRVGRIIPLDFSSHLLEALRSSYYVLRNGKVLCLFPEGIRSLDGGIKEFKKGFGILVKESDVKVLPVMLEGAFETWPRTSPFPKPHPVTVRFGEALEPKELEDAGFRMGAKDAYGAICITAKDFLMKLKEER